MQAHNILSFPNELERLEAEAQIYLDKSIESLQAFVATLQRIQDSKLHKGSWASYLRTRWGIADSTLRNWRQATTAAEIMLSVVDSTITPTQAAKVARVLSKLPNDLDLRLSAYAKAYEHTGKLTPSEAELLIAYHEIDRVRKQDILTIEGVDFDAKSLVLDENIKQELYELHKRKTAHIDASQGLESKRLEIAQKDVLEAIGKLLGIDMSNWQDVAIIGKVKL